MKIAVDAMGGDHAPDVVVQGALEAASEYGIEIILIGDKQAIKKDFAENLDRAGVEVRHCGSVVFMGEQPMRAVRQKKDASIRVAFDIVKKGDADAVVSAGHSGAMLAAAILTLGRVPGVERPAFANIFPGEMGEVLLIDVGANVDCRPVHLLQFGMMAHVFATSCRGMKDPKIGLLSIGREKGKGNEQVRQAHELFRASPLHFVGNVEGRDIFSGRTQIIVCDGFVGNIVLKVLEGMAESITGMIEEEIARSVTRGQDERLVRGLFGNLRRHLDHEDYGGAPILGINGVGIVCHGASSPRAIKKALKVAEDYARNEVPAKLSTNLARFQRKEASQEE